MLPGHSLYHVPICEYKENLEKIATHPCVMQQKPYILLVTPPPINLAQFPESYRGARKADQTREYAKACLEAAEACQKTIDGIQVLDFWGKMMKEIRWNEEGAAIPGTPGHPLNRALGRFFKDGMLLDTYA